MSKKSSRKKGSGLGLELRTLRGDFRGGEEKNRGIKLAKGKWLDGKTCADEF